MHQLLWTRRLVDLLGGSAESSARVFGCFFLGLSLGAALAAFLASRVVSPWKIAGLVELALAVLTVPILFLPWWTDWVWPVLGPSLLVGWEGGLIKLVLAIISIVPPAMMMGMSFPLVIQGCEGQADKTASESKAGLHKSSLSVTECNNEITLYTINTLGGTLGLIIVIGFALENFGLFWSMVLASFGNVLLGGLLLAKHMEPEPMALATGDRATTSVPISPGASALGSAGTSFSSVQVEVARNSPIPILILFLAFFSGFVVLASEVLAVQMLMLVGTLSIFGPAAVLFALLVCLTASAGWVARVTRRIATGADVHQMLGNVLMIGGLLLVIAPMIFMTLSQQGNWFASNYSVMTFAFKLTLLTLFSIGPAWLAIGLLFPLSMASTKVAKTYQANGDFNLSARNSVAGERVGILLAINGLGGLLGAEFTLRFLMPTFGIYGSLACLGVAMTIFAVILVAGSTRSGNLSQLMLPTGALFIGTWVAMTSIRALPTTNLRPGMSILDSQVGYEGVVAVVEDRKKDRAILVSNQYSLGGTTVRYDQERQLLLPLVMHPNPKQVGCIGLATGITAGAALGIADVEKVTSVELAPLVVRAAGNYFSDFNHAVTTDPRSLIVVEDGRTFFASTFNQFDIVTGDLFLPWAPGESRLYSEEHFKAVRRSLRSDGIFCQWLAMYQLTPQQVDSIVATFAKAFPNTFLFMNHFRSDTPMLAMVGWNSDSIKSIPWQTIQARCDNLRSNDSIRDPVLRHADGVAMLYLGKWEPGSRPIPIVTLDNPALEFSASRERLSGPPGQKYFRAVRWIEYCRAHRRNALKQADPDFQNRSALLELAGGLQELDYATLVKDKRAPSIAEQIRQQISSDIRSDTQADWSRWPATNLSWR